MTDFVLRMYDTLSGAESARAALLAEGFDADQVEIEAMNSEAGPVAGNFTVGNSSDHSDHSGVGDSGNYRDNFQDVRHGAVIKLVVAVDTDIGLAKATEVLDRLKASPH
ncbi:MAG: hypothetical protein JWR21_3792 [Herminiimonas sp.]|nr:hypothetical protein [Herminiimonas sp.]MDB5852940.1 hypothetical protein [Herminiimonas sp.]